MINDLTIKFVDSSHNMVALYVKGSDRPTYCPMSAIEHSMSEEVKKEIILMKLLGDDVDEKNEN